MNTILLRGTVASKIKFSHSSHGENFYEFRLKSERKSKKEDILICLVPEIILEKCSIIEHEKIEVQGEIRTINRKNHKHIYVFVQDAMCGGEVNSLPDVNEVKMDAHICIQPNLRRTSASNRRVCDVIAASNRQYGSDYIPCIAWGRYATYVSKCDVGTHLEIIGRLQSRENKGLQGVEAIDLIMVAKYLERIADHATNIAEWVEFSITGIHKSSVV